MAEAERQQIAETLHDDIGQSLALMRIQLGRLTREVSDKARTELESVMDLVQTTIDSTRSLMLQMSPSALELGFWSAVDSLTAAHRRRRIASSDAATRSSTPSLIGPTARRRPRAS